MACIWPRDIKIFSFSTGNEPEKSLIIDEIEKIEKVCLLGCVLEIKDINSY